jgi:hypothetical protein
MASVKAREAVKAATSYLNDVRDLIAQQLENLRLEELELSEDNRMWLVTLGFDVPSLHQFSEIEKALITSGIQKPQKDYQRQYKIFQVNAETGAVQSMKVRSL